MARACDSGDVAARHPTAESLARGSAALAPAPRERGRLVCVVARREEGHRRIDGSIALTPEGGVDGDAWGRRRDPKTDAQVTVMQADIAVLIANGGPLSLFGDNLFVDLDCSRDNLPAGSRLQVGEVVLEVTPLPHNGCRKFRERFGGDALSFVQAPETRALNRRGIHARVIRGGDVSAGDQVRVIRRG